MDNSRREWLADPGVTRVVMEATCDSGKPPCHVLEGDVLETAGFAQV